MPESILREKVGIFVVHRREKALIGSLYRIRLLKKFILTTFWPLRGLTIELSKLCGGMVDTPDLKSVGCGFKPHHS